MTVHAQLRAAYHASGLSYQDIAYLAGVSGGTVLRIMNGKNTTIDRLLKVAKALGVPTIALD